MKKILLILCVAFGLNQTSNAQIQFGLKGGVNYNSDSFKEVSNDVLYESAKSKTGYHAGIWVRVKLPIVGFYIRPELVYTNLKSEVTSRDQNTTANYDFQKIDIPVLFGKKVFGVGNIFIGPSFQYIIDGDFSADDLSDITTDASGFSVGLQLGAGVELGKLGVDVRWERGFSDTESKIISNNSDPDFVFDTRVNQIIIGLSYQL